MADDVKVILGQRMDSQMIRFVGAALSNRVVNQIKGYGYRLSRFEDGMKVGQNWLYEFTKIGL